MPETETQTNDGETVVGDDDEDDFTQIRILLVLGVMTCFINVGNVFSVDSVLINNPFFNSNQTNVTLSPIFVETSEVLTSLLPRLVGILATSLCGCLFDRSGLGRTALLFSIGSPLGTGATMLSSFTGDPKLALLLLIIGTSLFLSSVACLFVIQVSIVLKFFPVVYQATMFGILLSVHYIAFVFGFWLAPRLNQKLWVSFAATMISVVGASILCHVEIVAGLKEPEESSPDDDEKSEHSSLCTSILGFRNLKGLYWLLAVILMLASLPSFLNINLSQILGNEMALHGVCVLVSAPLIGLAASYFRLSSTLGLTGAGLMVIALGVNLVGLLPPLTAVFLGIGYTSIFVAMYPLIPRYVGKDCLGFANGIIGSGGGICLTVFDFLSVFYKESDILDIIYLSATVAQWVLILAMFIVLCWRKSGIDEEEKTLLTK